MNKLLLITLFALVFVANGAQRKTAKYVDTKTVMAELDQDKFGNTFLSAIALNIAAKSPLDDITILINQIMAQIAEDQAVADEKNKTDQAVCDETIGSFNKQIQETRETIASLEKAITDNTEILTQAKQDLAQAEKDYDETVTAIQIGTAEREQSHANWAEQDYQNAISIATLEEGVKLIQHMVHGVAFAQIKQRYDKVIEKLQNTDDKHSTLFKPLITSLTQLATKLNYENVMKIIELLKNIRAGIVEEKEAARTAEEKAQADWEILLTHLEQQKKSLAEKKARLKALITNTEALLVQLGASLENHKVNLEDLEESLAAQVAWCDEQSSIYMTQTAERDRETEILMILQKHLQEKFAAVSEYLEGRTGPE